MGGGLEVSPLKLIGHDYDLLRLVLVVNAKPGDMVQVVGLCVMPASNATIFAVALVTIAITETVMCGKAPMSWGNTNPSQGINLLRTANCKKHSQHI